MIYPYSSPLILTDTIYMNYGGLTGTTTQAQRDAAYWMAEMKASDDIGTYLTPTIVSGTYVYQSRLLLDHGYVNSIILTRFIDFEEDIYYTVSGTSNVYVSLWKDDYGIADLGYAVANCQCHTAWRPSPYKVQIVYNTGLSSGTSYYPNILLALTTYAQIIINEVIGYGNEAPGDVGVQKFANQEYREERVGLLRTVFGTSAKANFAHKLLTQFRKRRRVKL